MKRITLFVGMMVLAAALVCLPAPAKAAMWVGMEIGPNWMADSDVKASGDGVSLSANYKWETKVLGGAIFGYHFINSGFLAYNWPDWMKYFQFAIDFSYTTIEAGPKSGSIPDLVDLRVSRIKGDVFTVAFLFIGCYGFYPDSVSPFGRVIPYVGVGPALVQSWIQGSGSGSFDGGGGANFNRSSTDIGLVAEAGVRFMALKNVSLDLAFRYRWLQPNYNIVFGTVEATTVKVGIHDAHLFNVLFRANYHF